MPCMGFHTGLNTPTHVWRWDSCVLFSYHGDSQVLVGFNLVSLLCKLPKFRGHTLYACWRQLGSLPAKSDPRMTGGPDSFCVSAREPWAQRDPVILMVGSLASRTEPGPSIFSVNITSARRTPLQLHSKANSERDSILSPWEPNWAVWHQRRMAAPLEGIRLDPSAEFRNKAELPVFLQTPVL